MKNIRKITYLIFFLLSLISINKVKAFEQTWDHSESGYMNYARWNKNEVIADGHDFVEIYSWFHNNSTGEDLSQEVYADKGISMTGTTPQNYPVQLCSSLMTNTSSKDVPAVFKSTTPGKKKIYLMGAWTGPCSPERYIEINFVAKETTSSVAPAPRRVAPAPTPPVKPIVSLTNSYNIPSALNNSVPKPFTSTETPIIHKGEKLSFSGTTSPNAKLTMIIMSDPITKEVTADADGKWEYNLDPNELQLDYGDHTITAYATDSNGVKGDEVELAKFTLEKLPPVEVVKETYQFKYTDLFTPLNYILSAITLILIGGLIYLVVVRRKASANKVRPDNMAA